MLSNQMTERCRFPKKITIYWETKCYINDTSNTRSGEQWFLLSLEDKQSFQKQKYFKTVSDLQVQ